MNRRGTVLCWGFVLSFGELLLAVVRESYLTVSLTEMVYQIRTQSSHEHFLLRFFDIRSLWKFDRRWYIEWIERETWLRCLAMALHYRRFKYAHCPQNKLTGFDTAILSNPG